MRRLSLLSPVIFMLSMLCACGGSSVTIGVTPQSNPIFTSTPVTTASQGDPYAYALAATDPAGGTVTFSLTTAPSGASLSGSTVTWTPTASESRVSDSFTVTATTSSGGSATQSWSVTPDGTITVNWVNTYWSPSGPVQVPEPATGAENLEAAVPQADGSITLLRGSATSTPGVFVVPNVPAGNYWLSVGSGAFLTDTSTFDAGSNIPQGQVPATSTIQTTTFDLNVSIVPETTWESVEYITDPPSSGASVFGRPAGSTSITSAFSASGYTDWSQVSTAFLLQYVPETLGSQSTYVLGPELTLTGLAFTNGGTNTISGTLNAATETSLNLSVTGSQWAPLFNNIGPATATVQDSILTLIAEPYVTGVNANPSSTLLPALVLVAPTPGAVGTVPQGQTFLDPFASICSDFTGEPGTDVTALDPPILTDQDVGALQYGDPFDPTWTRALGFCQQATIPVPIPNSTATYSFLLVDGESVAPSNAPIVPIALPVQNPTINGSSFYNANTIETTAPTLSWSAPTGTPPYGYKVREFLLSTLDGAPAYLSVATYNTAATSVTLLPLAGGNTYIFTITSEVDGVANMQTKPFRSALPTGFSSVVSAPITISPSAASPQIRGDIETWRRLVNPKQDSSPQNSSRATLSSSCSPPSGSAVRVFCE